MNKNGNVEGLLSSSSTDFQAAFDAGRETHIVCDVFEDVLHVLVPPGCTLQSMERLLPAPTRIIANPTLHDIEGFASYIAEFKSEGTRIFVDETDLTFFTIFDHHAKDAPAWGDHSASMKLEIAPEWQRFLQYDGKKLTPMDFAELIEDNLEYISAEDMSSADLLTMAQSFKIDFKGNQLQVEDSLQRGLRNLVIKDEGVLQGRVKDGKELEFPEKLKLNLRIFKNQETYEISVFLRYRASKEAVVFFIKIPDPPGIREKAFKAVMDKVRETTSLPTLKGRYAGPRHK